MIVYVHVHVITETVNLFFFCVPSFPRKGKMYKLIAKTANGAILPPILIRKQLEEIVELAGGTNKQCWYREKRGEGERGRERENGNKRETKGQDISTALDTRVATSKCDNYNYRAVKSIPFNHSVSRY